MKVYVSFNFNEPDGEKDGPESRVSRPYFHRTISTFIVCGGKSINANVVACDRPFMVNMNPVIIGQDHFTFHTIANFAMEAKFLTQLFHSHHHDTIINIILHVIKHKCGHKIQKPFFTFNYEE